VPARLPVRPLEFLAGASRKAILAWRQRRLPLSPAHWIRQLRQYRSELQTAAGGDSSVAFETPNPRPAYERWRATNQLSGRVVEQMRASAGRLAEAGPRISIVVPTHDTPDAFLRELIASVRSQIYSRWELCIADDASSAAHVRPLLERAAREDPRIRLAFRTHTGHVVEATNTALELATGEFVAFLDHDDRLSPDALLQVAECLVQHPQTDWIYTDEDKFDEQGRHYEPQFKWGWDPEMAITHNFTHHLAVIRRTLVEGVGRLRRGLEGAQDLDLFLRVSERTTPDRIRHVPCVAYHWRAHRGSTASAGTQKPYVFRSAERAIRDAIARRGLRAEPFLPAVATRFGLCLHQLRWNPDLIRQLGDVTIVVPTRDRVELLSRCVESLIRTVDARFVRLLVVDDESVESSTASYLSELERAGVLRCRVLRTTRPDARFNYARLMTMAGAVAETPYLLHLNNDVEAVSTGWLEEMMGWMSIGGVGVVGARLVYPDATIQHAGVIVGARAGLAANLFQGLHRDAVGPNALPHAARNVSAVTGACLLTSASLFRELGGFDERSFAVQYNDVDYCLRAWAAGWRVVYTPQAELVHAESRSRGGAYDSAENLAFLARYPGVRDQFSNASVDVESSTLDTRPVHYVHGGRARWPVRALLVSHNLNREGAPLILLDYARFLRAGGCTLTVLASTDGPLRAAYESDGVEVVCRESPAMDGGLDAWREDLHVLGRDVNVGAADLVIANTLVSLHGVELARLHGVPSLWHIHESVALDASHGAFFGRFPREIIEPLLTDSIAQATRVLFQAQATAALFAHLNRRDHFRVLPGHVGTADIDARVRASDRDASRARLGVASDEVLVIAVGTICERKAQHLIVQAMHHVRRRSNQRVRCFLVGARADETLRGYLGSLRDLIVRLDLGDVVRLVPETAEVHDYYQSADIVVLASYLESFPRVLLEAMTYGLPIVSTRVFGVPEMVRDGHDALLVAPGDATAIARTICRLLDSPDLARALGSNAFAAVRHRFAERRLLDQYVELVKETALQSVPA
jgi:glycosyltransferase involved in cell wall biosynthesis